MKKIKNTYPTCISFLLLILIWTFVSTISKNNLPMPFDVIQTVKSEYKILLLQLCVTLKEAFLGIVFSLVLALVVVYLTYISDFVKKILSPIIFISQCIPIIAIAPIIVLALGYGLLPKVVIVILNCFFPICISLITAMEKTNQEQINLLKTMRASRNQIFKYVVIPSMRNSFFSGLKISITYSIISAVISEWLGGEHGIGIYITRAKKSYEMNKLMAAVILICVISILATKIIDSLQKKTFKKHSLIFMLFSIFMIFLSNNMHDTHSKNLFEIDMVLDYVPNTNHTGIYVADKLGFFNDEKIKVNIHQPPQDGASSLVLSGKAQFGIDFQDQLIPLIEKPDLAEKIMVLATIVQHNTATLISKNENSLSSINDLKEKRLAISSNPIDQKLFGFLTRNIKNVDFVITDVLDSIEALNGNIDVIPCYYGWDVIAAKINGVNVKNLFYREIDESLDFYTPVIVANKNFVLENPDVTQKFMRAISKGYTYAARHPFESAKLLCEAVPELSEKLVIESQEYLSKQYIADTDCWGYIDKNRWNRFYKWAYENGIAETKIYEKDVVCNDFL